MIFEKHMARVVVRGRKTQLRTPVLPAREFGIDKPCPYKVGETVSVRFMVALRTAEDDRKVAREWFEAPYGTWGSTSAHRELERQVAKTIASPRRRYVEVGHVLVTDVRREALHEITPVDALSMGYASREEFFAAWRAKYNTGPLAEVPVWAVTFEYVEAPERMLQAVGYGAANYTRDRSRRVRGGGSPVNERAQAKITEEANKNAGQVAAINQARRERYELGQRLERARAEAELRGVDISSPLRVIERQLVKIERRAFEGKAA